MSATVSTVTLAAPDPAFGAIGDTYRDSTTGVVWIKSANGWLIGAVSSSASPALASATMASGAGVPDVLTYRGASFFSGLGDPSATLGATDDSYINWTTGETWVRNAAGWLKIGTALAGPAGDKGKTGTSFLAGQGMPAASLGAPGDSYLDLTGGGVYLQTGLAWAATGGAVASLDANRNLAVPGNTVTIGSGAVTITTDATGHVTITATGVTLVIDLPTDPPATKGQLWNNANLMGIAPGPTS